MPVFINFWYYKERLGIQKNFGSTARCYKRQTLAVNPNLVWKLKIFFFIPII